MKSTLLIFLMLTNLAIAAQSCKDAPLTDRNRWERPDIYKELVCTDDFDLDGKPDQLSAQQDGGSQSSSLWIQVKLSMLGMLKIEATFSFSSMVNTVSIPKKLLQPELTPLRKIIETILFKKILESPDPSFDRLVHSSSPLAWNSGKPRMPDSYAVAISEKADKKWFETFNRKDNSPFWAYYMGINHRRSDRAKLNGSFRQLADQPPYQLYGCAHGLVLYDKGKNQHAWLYVFKGGYKLRHPSIKGATLKNNRANIKINMYDTFLPDSVTIDLKSGAILQNP